MLSAGFYKPTKLAEALEFLQNNHEVKILAGGTDLLVAGRQGQMKENHLMDITSLKELKGIKEDETNLYIGALLTHSEIADNPLVKKHASLLAEAVLVIGSPQIRNRGTIGGNIVNASPAADSIPALVALQARVTLLKAEGERVVPIQEFLEGAYKTQIAPQELLINVIIPKTPAKSRSKFVKVGRRNSLAISRVSMAGIAEQEEDGTIKFVRLVPGAVFSVPRVIEEVEQMLVGLKPSLKIIKEVARLVSEKVVEITGIRWSTPYKKPVCANLSQLVLQEILGGITDE
jgi:CO/xanthine dehydrogenase FAD-binding subunit